MSKTQRPLMHCRLLQNRNLEYLQDRPERLMRRHKGLLRPRSRLPGGNPSTFATKWMLY